MGLWDTRASVTRRVLPPCWLRIKKGRNKPTVSYILRPARTALLTTGIQLYDNTMGKRDGAAENGMRYFYECNYAAY